MPIWHIGGVTRVDEVVSVGNISFTFVPGHAGGRGNECADSLAGIVTLGIGQAKMGLIF